MTWATVLRPCATPRVESSHSPAPAPAGARGSHLGMALRQLHIEAGATRRAHPLRKVCCVLCPLRESVVEGGRCLCFELGTERGGEADGGAGEASARRAGWGGGSEASDKACKWQSAQPHLRAKDAASVATTSTADAAPPSPQRRVMRVNGVSLSPTRRNAA